MRRVCLVALTLGLLWAGARADAAWYCEPLRGYYPWVRSCPLPWRAVGPEAVQQPLAIPPGQVTPGGSSGSQPAANKQPSFALSPALVRGDALDAWCKGETTPLLVAECGDDELRALAIARLQAFDEAKARLSPERQKVLVADQNGWAMSSPQACGLNADNRPALPLSPELKQCLANAGRARLQYLKSYGQSTANTNAPSPAPAPPAPVPQSKSNEAQPSATITIPPAAGPAKAASGDSGQAAAPHRESSLAKLGDFTRMGAMLLAIIVVFVWAVTVWLQGRSRRAGKASPTRSSS